MDTTALIGTSVTEVGDDELVRMAEEGVEEAVSNEVFSAYKFREIVPGCCPHPGDIVESGSLSAIELPPAVYPLVDSIPQNLIKSGLLSSLQLEGILFACQRHQVILENGNRAGFFIGDAAGVGKGRQIAGIILDNYARGRTKHIWFSISSDLVVDAKRDLADINCFIKVIEGCQQLDKETRVLGLTAEYKEGILFSTYATLVSSVSKGGPFNASKLSRLQQLVDWCGGTEFDGCLIFDECHKAKHFVPGNEQASTKVAVAVTTLQRLLPKARVVYCSATGVSDVKNMAFMERLGLWGDGAAFKSFEAFLETVQKKGLGIAEMLAMEMKSSGTYVSRSLSFKQAEFITLEITLTEEQRKTYNMAAHVWNELRKALMAAVQRTRVTNNRTWSAYWAAHQRFFKQLCLGMKVPTIVEDVKSSLAAGLSVVIGLQTTGEASLQSEVNKVDSQPQGFISLCREILSRFVEQHFPTVIEGLTTANSEPVPDEWSCTAKKMLLEFAAKIPLPDSPLDEIIDKLGGPDSVAEMTGRRWRMVRQSPNETPSLQLRDAVDSSGGGVETLNVRERNMFMSGKKLVAIISDAASTGISLHADSRVANQRRRVHLTVELAWSADKAVQQLGRSHRSNQSSGPLYKLLTTNLGGERRFAACVARRLQSLGALTRGDRRAATGADLLEFNFDTPYGRTSLRAMYAAICQRTIVPNVSLSSVNDGKTNLDVFNNELMECLERMDVVEFETMSSAVKVKDKEAGDVGRFLNRILGLSVERQNLIFRYFTACLDAQIAAAKKEGRYNEGLVDIVASSVQMIGEPRLVFPTKSLNNPTFHVTLEIDRGMSWEQANIRLDSHPGELNGFYGSRRELRNGKRWFVLATQKEGSTHLFRVARPNTGVSSFDEEKSDLMQKYVKVTQQEAEQYWKEQFVVTIDHCIHGPKCRLGRSCTVGMRCYKVHLLCGGTMNLMSLLELTVARYSTQLRLTKVECSLRVVRAQLDNGKRVVGVRYPEILIPIAEKGIVDENFLRGNSSQQNEPAGQRPGLDQTISRPINVIDLDPSSPAETLPSAGTPLSITIETPSAVIQRYLQKATTAPMTIKQFFKPRNNVCAVPSVELNGEVSQIEDGTLAAAAAAVAAVCDDKTVASEASSATNSDENDFTEDSLNSARSKTNKESIVFQQESRDKVLDPGSVAQFKKLPAKRGKCSNKLPASKKSKQSSITSLFTSKEPVSSALKQAAETETRCPICNKVFDAGVSNKDFNAHIDSCLIE